MGICSSKHTVSEIPQPKCAKYTSKEIDKSLKKAKTVDEQINKILLLGAGSSGKSTLYKHAVSIFGEGFNRESRCFTISIICDNILCAMKTLCKQSQRLGYAISQQNYLASQLIKKTSSSYGSLNDLKKGYGTLSIGKAIQQLWQDDGIKSTYMQRSRYFLDDSASYYFDKLDQIMSSEYIPNDEDIIRVRIPTTGVIETSLNIDNNFIKLFDVGGQRSERRKWMHCFDNVTAIVFLASLSGYDEILFEDKHSNRMIEAMELFDQIINCGWFVTSSIILFLNKRDLFQEKIKKVPLKICFPEFRGPNTYDIGRLYIRNQFIRYNNHPEKTIYTHFTCATDTNNVHMICMSVQRIVWTRAMLSSGLM